MNFLIMQLDDFDVILGDEFFVVVKATLLPFISVMLIFYEKQPCYVPARRVTGNKKTSKGKEPMVSAMQVEHGLKKEEMTYLDALIEVKQDKFVEVPDAMARLLEEFVDVMPPKLPKTLPPRHVIDHKIELVLSPKPSSKAPYKCLLWSWLR